MASKTDIIWTLQISPGYYTIVSHTSRKSIVSDRESPYDGRYPGPVNGCDIDLDHAYSGTFVSSSCVPAMPCSCGRALLQFARCTRPSNRLTVL
jgi:hypothetical protein